MNKRKSKNKDNDHIVIVNPHFWTEAEVRISQLLPLKFECFLCVIMIRTLFSQLNQEFAYLFHIFVFQFTKLVISIINMSYCKHLRNQKYQYYFIVHSLLQSEKTFMLDGRVEHSSATDIYRSLVYRRRSTRQEVYPIKLVLNIIVHSLLQCEKTVLLDGRVRHSPATDIYRSPINLIGALSYQIGAFIAISPSKTPIKSQLRHCPTRIHREQ